MEKKYPIGNIAGIPEARLKAEQFYEEELAKLTDTVRKHEVSQEKETWIACYMAGYNAATPQGEVTTVYVPCMEDDPRACGSFTSTDGQCLCYMRESKVPVVEQGIGWVKASEFKTEKPVYRPYRRKREEDNEYDYGEIYVTEDAGEIFLDIDNERTFEPQSFEKWKDYEILHEGD